MRNITEEITKAKEEIRQLENKKGKLLNQMKEEERRARTRRLIERGAVLESLLDEPEQFSMEQIKELLEVAIQSPQAQSYLHKIKAVTADITSLA